MLSLEMCKRLKAAGFPIEACDEHLDTRCYHGVVGAETQLVRVSKQYSLPYCHAGKDALPSPNSDELIVEIERVCDTSSRAFDCLKHEGDETLSGNWEEWWQAETKCGKAIGRANSPAEALAELYIALKERK